MAYSITIKNQADLDKIVKLKYFSFSEMKCKSNPDFKCCDELLITDNAIKFFLDLDEFRHALGTPINMTNLYRCENKNNHVGGAKGSGHLEAVAADIYSNVMPSEQLFMRAEAFGYFKGLGVYLDSGFVHVDEKPRVSYWLNCKETEGKNIYFKNFDECNNEIVRVLTARRKQKR